MGEVVGLAIPVILAVVGVVALAYAVRIGRGAAREGTWPTCLAGAADGVVVEVAGRVVDGVRTRSPLLHRPCVWWRVHAATHSTGGRYRNGIHTAVHVCGAHQPQGSRGPGDAEEDADADEDDEGHLGRGRIAAEE